MREFLFLSHANPEDNEFTRWLALQLAKEGYPVWCDLTKLLGGEDFWKDIEQAIRKRTAKLIYVLSRTSNVKDGPLQELYVAQNVARQHDLKDFVIPLLIDDLPYREINIQLARINAIPFKQGWAGGFAQLLEKLEGHQVSKKPNFSPAAVTSWWREQFSADLGVSEQSEKYLSNRFMIQHLPDKIWLHALSEKPEEPLEFPEDFLFPALQRGQLIVSFAEAEDFQGLDTPFRIRESFEYSISEFLDGKPSQRFFDLKQRRDFFYSLLRIGWQKAMKEKGLLSYQLSDKAMVFSFPKDMIDGDKIFFTGVDGKRSYRQIVGYKTTYNSSTQTSVKRFWHFGIQAKPIVHPCKAYAVKPHAVFSDDGSVLWDNTDKMHRARRSQCKDWWNSDWRDRILAVMSWLSDGNYTIQIMLGSNVKMEVSSSPLTFSSPVSYADPSKENALTDIDPNEEDEFEEEEEDKI